MVVSPVTGSLFAPFFFPLGIAFMGAQSAVMMKMAGENWQYGKRRISAMTNEEFNKMTPLRLYQMETAELQAIIPSIEQSLQSMTPLTATIVTEMLNTFKVGAQATGAYIQDLGNTPLGNIIKSALVVWMPWLIPLMDAIPDLGETEPAPKIDLPIPFEKPDTPFIKPSPGNQPSIKKVPDTYATSTAALSLYWTLQDDYNTLTIKRFAALQKSGQAGARPFDDLRVNKVQQIKLMKLNYPSIHRDWLAKYNPTNKYIV